MLILICKCCLCFYAFCFKTECLVLAVRVCVHDPILIVCEHDILQTAGGNFTEFTTYVHSGTNMNLDFEVKGGHNESSYGRESFVMHLSCVGIPSRQSAVKDLLVLCCNSVSVRFGLLLPQICTIFYLDTILIIFLSCSRR